MKLSHEDIDKCMNHLKKGSKSFYRAARLLPERLRPPTAAVYAFCRATDDMVDNPPDREEAAAAPQHETVLQTLRDRLDSVYLGDNLNDFVDRAFSWVVKEYSIPRSLPEALLEGYGWDLEKREYHTISDVRAYSARVAAAVGLMMTVLMERREKNTLARACDLGVAMQLTNIARDVGEDAHCDRLYLPREWMIEEGIDPDEWMKQPEFNSGIGKVTERLLEEADRLYQQAEAGIAELPEDGRTAIWAARLIYADIGRVIRKNKNDSVTRRAYTTGPRKARLLVRAVLKARSKKNNVGVCLNLPPLEETRHLVESVLQ